MITNSTNTILKPTKIFFAAVFVFLMVGMGNVSGVTITVTSNTNWSAITTGSGPGGLPNNADAIIVRGGKTLTVDVTNAVCASIQLGGTAENSAGTLTFSGVNPNVTVSGLVQVGGWGNTNRRGTITFTSGSTLDALSITLGGTGATPAAGIITMTLGGTLRTGSFIVNTVVGNTWTQGTGTGTVIMDATNTLPATIFTSFRNLTISTGTTTLGVAIPTMSETLTVKAGATLALTTLPLGATTAPTSVVMEIGTTGSAISGTGAGVLHLGGNVTVNDITGSSGATISCPISLDGTRTFTVADGTSAADLTVSSIVANGSATSGITKVGAGTMNLSGINTYTGATTVNGGTLKAGVATQAFGVTSAVTLANTANVILDITGFNNTIGSLTGGGANGGNVTLGTATLTVGSDGTSPAVYAGVISGTGGILTKTGSGTLILSGANTYTGATTITLGELRLNPSADITLNTQIVLNGGKLSTTGITAARTIINSSTLQLNANSSIDLGSNAHSLKFANSNAISWAGTTLTINGWTGIAGLSGTAGKIFFGAGTGTLIAGQLAKISFTGYSGTPILLGTGELVPPCPVLAITGSPTNHGNSCIGIAATPVTYTITNTGTTATGVSVTSNNSQFVISGAPTTVTGGGGTATYVVTFTPSGSGSQSATITVTSTTFGSNSPTSSLSGTGNPPIGNNAIDFTNGQHGTICGTAPENGNAVLTSPSGTVFINVGFASYGTPTGTCPTFTLGSCHALTSQTVSEGYLLGNNTASIPATNGVFGDPCVGTLKRLYVLATYTEPICSGNTPGTISGGSPTGGNGSFIYLWESSTTSSSSGFASATGTNNTQNYTPGSLTQTIWYRRTVTSGGCSNTATAIQITVNLLPTVNAGGAVTAICQGGTTAALGGSYGGGATAAIWSAPSGTFANNTGSTPSTTTFTAAANSTTPITLTLTTSGGSCGTTSANKQVTVNPLPVAAGTITGTATVCQGQATVAYSVPAITNATNYTWAYSGTGTTITGSTNSVTITFAANATSGNLTVRGTNACGNGTVSANYAITVNPLPVAAGIISGTAAICQGSSQIYSVTNVAGVTYTWAFPAGWTQTGGGTTNSITVTVGATSGNVQVTPSNTCGTGIAQTLATTVSTSVPGAAGTITGTASVYKGQTGVAYSVGAIIGATSYSWSYSGTGATITGTSNSVTIDFAIGATSGNLTVRGTNSCGNGTVSANYAITVTPPPCITSQPSNVTVCSGNPTSFAIVTTGTGYQWQLSINNGVNWTNITAPGTNPTYAGYNSSKTLTLTNVVAANNGYLYRCIVSTGCPATSNAATLNVGMDIYSPRLSANPDLIDPPATSSIISLTNTQLGLRYQLMANKSTVVGSPVIGTGGSIDFAVVTPSSSTNYTVIATSISSACKDTINDKKTIIVNEDGLIIDLHPCAGQPGSNFFTNSEFGTTTSNYYSTPNPVNNPGVIFGNPLGAYTSYTFGFVGGEIPDGNYVIANSTTGMYRQPPAGDNNIWLLTNDRSAPLVIPPAVGTGHMYIINAAYAPGTFYSETLTGLCDSTKYEFSAEMINLYAGNWVPYGTASLDYFPTDDQGNKYSVLPNIDFMINGKIAFNTGNIMNDGSWHTFGFTFRTGGLSSIALTMRNNAPGGIGNDIALDNIVIRACGPQISLNIITTLPVCPGTPVMMTAQIIASDYITPVYQWQISTDGGVNWSNISGANSTSYTENSPISGHKYRFITGETIPSLTNPNCHVASNPVTILTTADILTTTPATSCSTGIVTLGATANSGSTIKWYDSPTGGTLLKTQATPSTYITPPLSNTITYYVDATQSGCTSSPRIPIVATIYPGTVTASVSISANPGTNLCTGNSVTFTATPTNGGMAPLYQWKKNGTNITAATTSIYTTNTLVNNDVITCVMTENPDNVCITGSPATPISNPLTMTVASMAASVSIAASPGNTICNGISVTFTATPTNGGAIPTYQWKLNGSNISGATNSTYTTTTLANNNQIACVMTSSFICATGNPATSNIVTMTVNPNPIVSVGGAMAAICQGGTSAALGGSFGGGATAAIWSAPSGTFTNNTGSTPGTATFTAVANSTTPITLTLTTSGGSCGTTSANKNIVVNPNPTVNVGGAMASICQGGTSAALGGSFGGGATAAIWSAPSGTFTNNTGSTPNTATFTAAANSTTPITLTLTTSGGSCSTTSANKQIVVNPNLPASVSIAASATTICAGTSVTFTATPTNGGPTPSYQWKVGATNVGTNSTTYTDAALTNGASVTCVMISNASPCSTGSPATSSAITMTVNPLLPASVSISAVPSGAICAGTSVTFTATPTNGGTPAYQWYNGASLIAGATNPTYTSAALANGASITVQMTSNASCATGSPATSNAITMTVNPTVGIPVFTLGATSTRCQGAGSVTYTATATNTTGITYSLDAASVTGGNSIVAVTGAVIYVAGWSGTSIITASAAGCNGPSTATHTVTETPTVGIPVFTLGATSTRCQGAGSVTYTATATNTTGITYTLDAASVTGGNSIVAGTGAVTYVAGWSGTSIITASAVGCNGPSIAIHTVTIIGDLIWTGTVSTDWNVTGNWTCGAIPDLTRNVQIPNVTNKPILSTGAAGTAKNIVIDNLSSLTIIGNTMQIAGSITNSGTFTATAGTIEMKGAVAQFIGAGVFAGNTIMNLTVNNPIGVTLQGPLNITGIVTAVIGNLSSGGNLTLLSSAAQTALIDGTGTGTVTGNVTMQRYLPSAFGYKYFSSPFQAATVNEFADDMDLAATFPTFYKYDEENHRDSSGVNLYSSGWVKYLAGNLSPMSSYAVNFGSALPAKTVNITGVVNNSSLNVSLVNNNRKYTKGFNLIGNPYPSPVDWDIPGWTKTNIDDAIYFFNAGNTDQYTGLYSSYVGGVSTGNGDNLIASMQGFFVHVSDGTYPVSALLGVTNPVRTNDLNPLFKVANIDDRTILRFAAHFETENAIEDAAVIYFDDNAHRSFDKDMDALKLLNTDVLVPNLYTLSTDSKQLSINGMPFPADSITKIPLGITTLSDGWINFKANDISQLPSNMHIYLLDAEKGVTQDLKQQPAYRFLLKTGEYNQRFTLVFSLSDINDPTTLHEKMFAISRSADRLLVKINLPFNTKGNLSLTNMAGQNIIRRDVFEKETIEINPDLIIGVYIVTVISGKRIESEKILMRKDYE